MCTCENGYTGQNCQTGKFNNVYFSVYEHIFKLKKKKSAPCDNVTCQNGATCVNFDNSTSPYFRCNCPSDFTGYFCEIGE
jgi:hypothetical protein